MRVRVYLGLMTMGRIKGPGCCNDYCRTTITATTATTTTVRTAKYFVVAGFGNAREQSSPMPTYQRRRSGNELRTNQPDTSTHPEPIRTQQRRCSWFLFNVVMVSYTHKHTHSRIYMCRSSRPSRMGWMIGCLVCNNCNCIISEDLPLFHLSRSSVSSWDHGHARTHTAQ
jgi:hypothetical protein